MISKGVIYFSILKYIEISITAISTFLVAKKVGSVEMGLGLPVLLFITYSNYFSLGVNQSLIKNFGLFSDKSPKDLSIFYRANMLIVLIACIISCICSFILFRINDFVFISIISSGILLRSFFMTYFRVNNKIEVLNKNNLIFSVILLGGVIYYTTTFHEYLISWAIAIAMGLLLYFIDYLKFNNYKLEFILNGLTFKDLKVNIKEGVKVGLVGFVATILLSIDRVFIKDLDISSSIKGSYQLADYFGMAFYLFITTILFYYYPKKIILLRENVKFRLKYIGYIYKAMFLIPIVLVLAFGSSYIVQKFIFMEYQYLIYFIPLNIFIKLTILMLTSLSSLYLVKNREVHYVRNLFIVVALIVLINLTLVYLFSLNYVMFVIPLITAVSILIFAIIKIKEHEIEEKATS